MSGLGEHFHREPRTVVFIRIPETSARLEVERQYTVVKTAGCDAIVIGTYAFGAAYGPAVARCEGDERG
jgi:hypothetical protein